MKNALIITYYWPPSAGGGVQRWLKFSKYLPDYGWHPIIFTPDNPSFPIKDDSLEKDVNEEVEVLKFPIWEPYALAGKKNAGKQGVVESGNKSILTKLMIWLRGNLIIPDPRVFWVKPSVKFLSGLIRDRNIEVIITTGPPHSIHLIGNKLKTKTGIPWIADFRDPWSNWDILDELMVSNWARSIHRKLESKVFANADEVITVSPTWATEFESQYSRSVNVITNGFDEEDFEPVNYDFNQKGFTILHAGLLNSFRNPRYFWEVIREMAISQPDFLNDCTITLAGVIDEDILEEIKNDEILSQLVEIKGYISHRQVLELYSENYLLLLLTNNTPNQKGHIPGKLFEYLAVNRYILLLGDPKGDAASIVEETGTGLNVSSNSKDEIREALDFMYKNYKLKKEPKSGETEGYTRRNLTKRLSELLNNLVE